MSVTAPASISSDSGRMPWSIAAAGLIGLLALTLTTGILPMTPVLVVGILASYFTPARLEGETFNRWWVRLSLVIVIIILNQGEIGNNDYAIGSARVRNIMSQVYAAELAVQCWRRSGQPVRSRLIALAASGLLMLTAANTFNEQYIKFIAPVYMLLVGFGLYTARSRRLSRGATIARIAFMLLALSLGGIVYVAIDFNRGKLTELSNRLLGERFNLEATGMASAPQLGETFGLRGSTARVLRIHHPVGDPHLRGMAFDTYSSGRWGPNYADRQYRTAQEKDLSPLANRPKGSEMKIERLASDNPLVYAPLQSAGILTEDASDVEWAKENGGPIRTRARPPYEYRVTASASEVYQGILANPLTRENRGRYLQLPPRLDDRIPALARKITTGARTDAEKVRAVTDYLIGNYSYSLRFQPGRGEPLVNFLTAEPKRGAHCEYFAASSAILLRCVGVPSRYVTGYLAHESEGEDTTIVRQRDAHAWTEAWVNGVGWVTVDATPGDGRPDTDNSPVEWWRTASEKIQDALQSFAEFLAGLTTEQIVVIVGCIVIAGILYSVRLYRKRQMALALASFAYTPPERQLAEMIVRFEGVFARRGAAFPTAKTYREHLEDLAAQVASKGENGKTPSRTAPLLSVGPLLDSARQFVTLYEETRFGQRNQPETLERLRRLVDEMERTK